MFFYLQSLAFVYFLLRTSPFSYCFNRISNAFGSNASLGYNCIVSFDDLEVFKLIL